MKRKKTELPGRTSRGLPTAVFFIARELRTAVDRRLAPYGLTCQQAALLIRCVHDQGASLQQLMPHLGTDNAGVSRLVDRLEAAALVQRTRGSDRRALALRATEAGIALAPRLEEVMVGLHRELVAGLSRVEVAATRELLGKLLARARALNDAEQPPQPEDACVR
jgi:DNA-binding MarR family transcriptional regulator